MRRVSRLRDLAAAFLIAAFVLSTVAPSFAAGGQTGSLSGTFIDATTKQPLPNVSIEAVSPTGRYSAKTDSQGNFQIIGMIVDTYVVSASVTGYQPFSVSGVTIQGDQSVSLGTDALAKSTTTIGRTVGRSPSSVFQPSQTVDSYTVTGEKLLQTTGKVASTNEKDLALSVPGVTLTSSGAITIRGSLRTEVGYQLDGVPFTEPFFSENGSANQFNGIGTLNVVEGSGDATQIGVGSGVFNLIPKRGTSPGFGYFDAEVGAPNAKDQLAFEYGVASKDGRFSNYVAFTGYNSQPYNGYRNSDAASYGNYYAYSKEVSRQWLDNFIFKFGKDQGQAIQVLYVNQLLNDYGNYGGLGQNSANPSAYYFNDYANPAIGGFPQLGGAPWEGDYNAQVGLNPDVPQNGIGTPNSAVLANSVNTRYLKLEYDNNLDAATFLRLRYYNWENLTTTSNDTGSYSVNVGGLGSYPVYSTVGGPRVGGTFDLQHQFGNNLTVSLEGTYETSHPIWDEYDPNAGIFLLQLDSLIGSDGPSADDFQPGGYLSQYFPNGIPRVPTTGINYNGAWFQQYGGGIRVQYSLKKLKLDLGVRKDYQRQNYGINPYNSGDPSNPSNVNPASITPQYTQPSVLQPRGAIAYQFGNDDSVRAGYGRSAVFLNAQTSGTPAGLLNAGAFIAVPPKPGSFTCGSGVSGAPTLVCQNYAQQLYWLYDQNFDAPDLGGGLPAIYSNYDFTYQHQFSNGLALKVTPFSRYGSQLPSFAYVTNLGAGAAVFTVNNKGVNLTSGVELGLNTKTVPVGFSGFLSATYQNAINSTPPLTNGEDSLPINQSGSLALNDTYRAGYVSPVSIRIGAEYKTKDGFRINPILQFNNGYPYSIGTTTPSNTTINGSFYNIPQVNFGAGTTYIEGFESASGSSLSTQYYDPAYPGNSFNPNIAATRGTPATSSTGGKLWHPNLQANLTLEYKHGHNVLGVQILNLFGTWYNGLVPQVNPYYQPVADGVSGPLTGVNPYATVFPNRGFANVPQDMYAFNNGAYIYVPNSGNGSMPGNVLQFYYQFQF